MRALPAMAGPGADRGASIVTDAAPYAEEAAAAFRAAGLAVNADTRNEKINAKVREHSLAHVPCWRGGAPEAENRQVALRRLAARTRRCVAG